MEQLLRIVQDDPSVFVLDVRTAPEYVAERLPFGRLRIPLDSLTQYRDLLPDTSVTIYTFCRTGRRSAIAAEVLPKLGYHHVKDVLGGITAWKNNRYETVSGTVSE